MFWRRSNCLIWSKFEKLWSFFFNFWSIWSIWVVFRCDSINVRVEFDSGLILDQIRCLNLKNLIEIRDRRWFCEVLGFEVHVNVWSDLFRFCCNSDELRQNKSSDINFEHFCGSFNIKIADLSWNSDSVFEDDEHSNWSDNPMFKLVGQLVWWSARIE